LGLEKYKYLLTKIELALLSYGALSPDGIVDVTDGLEGKRWKLAAQLTTRTETDEVPGETLSFQFSSLSCSFGGPVRDSEAGERHDLSFQTCGMGLHVPSADFRASRENEA